MADKRPLAAGLWSNAANWNGGTKPVSGDNVWLNSFTVTADEDIDLGAGTISSVAGGGAVAGGYLNVTATRTISCASATSGIANGSAGCINFFPTLPSVHLTFNGNIYGAQAGNISSGHGLYIGAPGILTVNGNVFGGNSGNATFGIQIQPASTLQTTVTINGNVAGSGTVATSTNATALSAPAGAANLDITINGNVTGGGISGAVCLGVAIANSGTTTLSITGTITSGWGGGVSFAPTVGGSITTNGNIVLGTGNAIPITVGGGNPSGIIGNITGNTSGTGLNYFVSWGPSFTLGLTLTAPSGTFSLAAGQFLLSLTGTALPSGAPVVINGNVTATTSTNGMLCSCLNAAITINGNLSGGANSTVYGANIGAHTSAFTVNGNVTGGTGANAYGIHTNNFNIGQLTVNGNVIAGAASASYGINIQGASNASIRVTGYISGQTTSSVASIGISSTGTGYHDLPADIRATMYGSGVILGGVGATYSVAGGVDWVQPAGSGQYFLSLVGTNMSGAVGARNITAAGTAGPLGFGGAGCNHTITANLTCTGTGQGVNFTPGAGGVVNWIGNIVAGAAAGVTGYTSPGTVNITGNVTGGTATNAYGLSLTSGGGTINVTGNVTGGSGNTSFGALISGAGTLNIWGRAIGADNAAGSHGAVNSNTAGTSTLFVQIPQACNYPNAPATSGAHGLSCTAPAFATVDAQEDGSGGWPAISGRAFAREAGINYVKMRASNLGSIVTMGDIAQDYPTPANVRKDITFNFGSLVGTLNVPPTGSVAIGVPVDNTVGTAALSPAALLGNDVLTRLADVPTVEVLGEMLESLM